MADRNRASMGRQLAEERNKRLEDALKSYSSDKTKQAVGRLLEEYIDENGTNYFTPGSSNTTLYFADDDYIREVEKVRLSDDEAHPLDDDDEINPLSGIVGWFKNKAKRRTKPEEEIDGSNEGFEMPDPNELEKHDDRLKNGLKPLQEDEYKPTESAFDNIEDDYKAEEPVESNGKEADSSDENKGGEAEPFVETDVDESVDNYESADSESVVSEDGLESETEDGNEQCADMPTEDESYNAASDEREIEEQPKPNADDSEVAESIPVTEQTIIATKPVLSDEAIEAEMARQAELAKTEDKENNEVKPIDEDIEVDKELLVDENSEKLEPPQLDDYDDDDEDDDDIPKKKSFFSMFKKKKKDVTDEDEEEDESVDKDEYSESEDYNSESEEEDYEDDDDYEDEFDDDDDDEDYDDYDEPAISAKKILLIIFIILLIGTITALAAVCYTYKTKFDSAASQIKEFQSQGVTETRSAEEDTEISSLKAQVASLTAENTRLKSSATSQTQAATTAAGEGVTQALQVVGSDDTTQATTQSAVSTASGKTYTIKDGDTGSKICKEVYGEYTEENWEKILSANGMTTSTVYHAGEVLKIPD